MRKLTLSLGLAAVCATSLVAVAPAATAAESGTQAAACITLWQTAGYKDGSRTFSGNDSNFSDNKWSSGSPMNDDANSGKNNCSHWVHMYADSNYNGQSYSLQPTSSDSDFGNNNFSNKASSLNGF
ncbi:peptidase inhibitor family I36 protein [Streptomyces sp. SHP 1-2]|uniref:peptidase inhibitor family I36 protein n=1 Tax=Streptomyces sp. SHP 1-2 TaxID=2769489 RepID=UPI0022380F83|nr:peptidase inhibitor family I36 protein [Streptomyces sp. SHP 1-2]MCW5252013.1 peptidase inhibitor family I36 protein [Streptomyces sp. SHP 1-2]